MKKVAAFFSTLVILFTTHYLLLTQAVYAICPVCTVAVATGLGLARWIGIDDTVSGVWIGGLILSSSLWLINILGKKNPKFLIFNSKFLIIVAMYLLILIPLAWTGIIGHPFNRIWGIDKLAVGITFGSLAFLAGVRTDKKIREIKGKQLFNFQKVVFPLLALITSSLIFYTITIH